MVLLPTRYKLEIDLDPDTIYEDQNDPELIDKIDTTTLLSLLLEEGNSLRGVRLESYWCEIDSLSDLKIANKLIESGKLKS